jgi:hypothetical protein
VHHKAKPGGKKTSPLDDIHATAWDPDWTTEFIDLLTVLTRLVELEPRQATLLDQILQGPLLSKTDLTATGVTWPTTKKDRTPRYPRTLDDSSDTLDFTT